MAPNQALDLYSEVLGKLELNYVEPIRLEDLLKKGTAYLEVALTEPDFLSKNLNQTKPEVIEQFRLNVHKMVLGRPSSLAWKRVPWYLPLPRQLKNKSD